MQHEGAAADARRLRFDQGQDQLGGLRDPGPIHLHIGGTDRGEQGDVDRAPESAGHRVGMHQDRAGENCDHQGDQDRHAEFAAQRGADRPAHRP